MAEGWGCACTPVRIISSNIPPDLSGHTRRMLIVGCEFFKPPLAVVLCPRMVGQDPVPRCPSDANAHSLLQGIVIGTGQRRAIAC